MKRLHQFVGSLLGALMCLTAVIPTAASSLLISPAPKTDAPEPAIVSMTDYRTADKGLNMFESGYNNEYVGVYQFNSAEKVLEVSYSTKQKEYRFCIRMENKTTLAENQSWMVVTYKTNTKTKAEMKLNNCNNSAVTLAKDISTSKGQWVRTEAVNINDASLGNVNYFARLRADMWDFIEVESTDTQSKLYIREIAFFTSKAEADSYYKDVPLTGTVSEDDAERIKNREENWETIKLIMSLIGRKLYLKDIATLDGPFEDIEEDSYSTLYFNKSTFAQDGYLKMVDVPARASFDEYSGVSAVKFAGHAPTDAWLNHTTYNVSFNAKSGVIEEDDYKYYVVSYASVSRTPHKLQIWTSYNSADTFSNIAEVPAGDTGWTVSNILPVTEAIKARLRSNGNLALLSNCADNNAQIYVSSITFFENKASAEKYVKQHNEYYCCEEGIDESKYTHVSFDKHSVDSAAITLEKLGVDRAPELGVHDDMYAVKFSGGSVVGWLNNSNYTLGFKNKIKDIAEKNDMKYMAVTYASVSTASYTLQLWSKDNDNKDIFPVLAEVPAGVVDWTVSDIVAVQEKFIDRFNNGDLLGALLNCSDPSAKIYISGITFFEDMDTAEKYVDMFNEAFGQDEGPVGIDESKFTHIPFNTTDGAYIQLYSLGEKPIPVIADHKGVSSAKFSSGSSGWPGSSNYTIGFNCPSKNTVKSDHMKYFAVAYASSSNAPYSIKLWTSYNGKEDHTNIADVPTGDTGWVISDAIVVSEAVAARVNSGDNLGFYLSCTDTNAGIYISGITFFEDMDTAEAYIDIFNASH